MFQHASSFNIWIPISPDNAADLPPWTVGKTLTRAVYVGALGDVVAVREDNVAVTFVAVPAGTWLPIAVRRINATGTSAQNLIAVYMN